MSKGYTISYFINVLQNTPTSTVTKLGVFNVVAPRFGAESVKVDALQSWLGYNTTAIASGSGRFASFGKTPRARLLTALKNRKVNGFV
jgi:hypothetical protein